MANTVLPWSNYTEAVVGLNHPTLTDVDNRALRALLNRSGFGPDAAFRGLPVGSSAVNAGSSDYTGTVPARITAAIADAAAAGLPYCFVPRVASDGTVMLPYTASLVTFNNAVKMIREGDTLLGYDVRAYGAAGNQTTDDTAAFQACANAVTQSPGSSGFEGIFYMPIGTYLITSPITFYTSLSSSILGNLTIRGAGREAVTIFTSTTETFKIGTSTATTDGVMLKDFSFVLQQTVGYRHGLVHLIFCREFAIDNIGLSSTNFGGFLLDLDASYNGNVSNCMAIGRKCYVYDLNVDSRTQEQSDSINLRNIVGINSDYCGFIRVGASSAVPNSHGIYVQHAKLVPNNSNPENSVDIQTTMTSSVSAGTSTTFTINSATNIAQGDLILVDVGNIAEIVEIATLNGTTVTPTTAYRYAHSSGAQVLKGCVGHVIGQGVYNVIFDEPHIEASAVGFHVASVAELEIRQPHAGCKDLVRVMESATPACTDCWVKGGSYFGNNGANNILHVTTVGDSGTFSRWRLQGPFRQLPSAVANIIAYVNDAGTNRQVIVENDDSTSQGAGFMKSYDSWPAGAGTTVWKQLSVGGTVVHAADASGGYNATYFKDTQVALTDGATVNVNAQLGDYFTLVAAGSRTIAAPTNAPPVGVSQCITFTIYNNTGGAMTTTWASGANAYSLAGAWVDPANTKRRTITFRWWQAAGLWIEVSRTAADQS